MQAVVIVDSTPLLLNTTYANRLQQYFSSKRIRGVMWSRFKKTPLEKEWFKDNIYGHVDGFKSLKHFRQIFHKTIDMNVPMILVDNDTNSLARGGFDCVIDLTKYTDFKTSDVVNIDAIITAIEKFIDEWKGQTSKKQLDVVPAKKRRKWQC